jgi:hypothetical protein
MNQNRQFRSLGIALSSRGFGYAVMEGHNALVDSGKKVINNDKNVRVLGHIEKLIIRNMPDVLVLQNVNAKGTHRALRIKDLHRDVVAMGKKQKLMVANVTGKELRRGLLGDESGTKYEMALALAKQFPDELAKRLPPKRKTWESEHSRMDIFEAAALALVQQAKMKHS